MYPCPNCAAGLRFNIPTQTLACDHCGSHFSPYNIGREKDAVEHDFFEAKVFTCPQCGAELISEDDTVATFCSYCGGTTVLDSRIENEKRPDKIITFKKTKEDCKKSYEMLVKRAFYTPKEFRNPEQLDKFRGIYMPYWVYKFRSENDISFEGTKAYYQNQYNITEYYRVYGHGSGEIDNIVYDSSSRFYDDLSSEINPYDVDDFQKFTPSFFSGFYADCGDVDSRVYEDDAKNVAVRYNASQVQKQRQVYELTVPYSEREKLNEQVMPNETETGIAMLPVWFLSYRTKDNKVAYAVVNGQTGKAAGDLPVDKKKFLGISAIVSVILFAIFSLFTLKPATILVIVLIITVIVFLISNSQMKKVIQKEQLENDQGINYVKALEKEIAAENEAKNNVGLDMAVATAEEIDEYVKSQNRAIRCAAAVNTAQKEQNEKKKGCLGCIGTGLLCVVLIVATWVFIPGFIEDRLPYNRVFCNILCALSAGLGVLACVLFIINTSRTGNPFKAGNPTKEEKKANRRRFLNKIKYWLAMIVALIVLIDEPVEDFIYYGAAVFCITMVIIAELQLMNRFNILATRKLPQLGKRGGDENA